MNKSSMLTECHCVGRLLQFLQKLFWAKNLRNNRISDFFLPYTCKIQVLFHNNHYSYDNALFMNTNVICAT